MRASREVNLILNRLRDNGYRAYLVGGCVRDLLLNKEVKDFDITTSAKPEEIKEVFKDFYIVETGIVFGTVIVVINKTPYEVTTFRTDGVYTDNRRPDSVSFSATLNEDVLRRDFTINALAIDEDDTLVDLVNGVSDLSNEIIRCIGNPEHRFREDALRILRGLRFSAKYGFIIEDETKKAMFQYAPLLDFISKERVFSELNQIFKYATHLGDFISDYYDILRVVLPELETIRYFEQNSKYHISTVFGHTCMALNYYREDSTLVKFALLFHDLGKPQAYFEDEEGYGHFYGHWDISENIAEKICERLCFTRKMRQDVCVLVKNHDVHPPTTKHSVRKLINKVGINLIDSWYAMKQCDILAHDVRTMGGLIEDYMTSLNLYKQVIEEENCLSVKDLQLNGKTLIAMGYPEGKLLGVILNDILDKVMAEELINEVGSLMWYVKEKYPLGVRYEV